MFLLCHHQIRERHQGVELVDHLSLFAYPYAIDCAEKPLQQQVDMLQHEIQMIGLRLLGWQMIKQHEETHLALQALLTALCFHARLTMPDCQVTETAEQRDSGEELEKDLGSFLSLYTLEHPLDRLVLCLGQEQLRLF